MTTLTTSRSFTRGPCLLQMTLNSFPQNIALKTMHLLSTATCVSLALCISTPAVLAQTVHRSHSPSVAHARDTPTLMPHRQTVWVRAEVLEVDTVHRTLLLQTTSGPMELQASETIRRLDQVKAGDLLDINYELALALAVVPDSGIRERTTDTSSSRTVRGRPSGSGYIEETLRVDVLEVNQAEASIRIRGARGHVGWVAVLDDEVLSRAKPGQQLVITYRLGVILAFRPG